MATVKTSKYERWCRIVFTPEKIAALKAEHGEQWAVVAWQDYYEAY